MTDVAPPLPSDGAVVADLRTMREYVGARSSQDDALLQARLDVAMRHVYAQTYADHWASPDLQEAILLLASRLYKRRQSPEGVAGFNAEGALVRIIAGDPDIAELIGPHIDYTTQAGIA